MEIEKELGELKELLSQCHGKMDAIEGKMGTVEDWQIKTHTLLTGYNGQGEGLLEQVRQNSVGIKRNTVILATLVGAGVLSGTGLGIAQLLTG